MGIRKKTKRYYISSYGHLGNDKFEPVAREYVAQGAVNGVDSIGDFVVAKAYAGPHNRAIVFNNWVQNSNYAQRTGYNATSIRYLNTSGDLEEISNIISNERGEKISINTAEFTDDYEEELIRYLIYQELGNSQEVTLAPYSYEWLSQEGEEYEEDEEIEEEDDFDELDDDGVTIIVEGFEPFVIKESSLPSFMLDPDTEDFVLEGVVETLVETEVIDETVQVEFSYPDTLSKIDFEDKDAFEWDIEDFLADTNDMIGLPYGQGEITDDIPGRDYFNYILNEGKVLFDSSEEVALNRETREVTFKEDSGTISIDTVDEVITETFDETVSFITEGSAFTEQEVEVTEGPEQFHFDRRIETEYLIETPLINKGRTLVLKSIEVTEEDSEGIPTKGILIYEEVIPRELRVSKKETHFDTLFEGFCEILPEDTSSLSPELKEAIKPSEEFSSSRPLVPPIPLLINGSNYFATGDTKRVLQQASILGYGEPYSKLIKTFLDLRNKPEGSFIREGKYNTINLVFGVPADVTSDFGRRYIAHFVRDIFSSKDPSMPDIYTLYEQYKQDYPSGLIPIGEYVELPYLPQLSFSLGLGRIHELNHSYKIAGYSYSEEEGRLFNGAMVGSTRYEYLGVLDYPTRARFAGRFVKILTTPLKSFVIREQLPDDKIGVHQITGFKCTAKIYKHNYKEWDFTDVYSRRHDDEYNHSFYVPINTALLKNYSLFDKNQISRDAVGMVVNIYIRKRVKRGWYSAVTSVFKNPFVLAAIVVTAVVNPVVALQVTTTLAAVSAFSPLLGDLAKPFVQIAVALFGEKLGGIIGQVAFTAFLVVVSAVTGGATLPAAIGSLGSAQTIAQLSIAAVNAGMQGHIERNMARIEAAGQADKLEYMEKMEELENLEKNPYAPRAVLEGMGIYPVVPKPETPDQFLARTLIDSHDVINTTQDTVYNFTEVLLDLENI